MMVSLKRKVTEQANVLSLFLTVVLSAIAYGWIEGTIYPYYPYRDELQILGHFTWYHLVFCFMFLVIGFTFSLTRALAMWSLKKGYMFAASAGSVIWGFWIEDMGYYSIVHGEILGPDSWVNWGLGGISILDHWIPIVYFILSFTGFALFSAAYLRSSRDILTMMKAMRLGLSKEKVKLQAPRNSKAFESLKYLCSIAPLAFAVQLFTVLAASVTTSNIPPGTLKIAFIGLAVLTPTLIMLILSNKIYDRLSCEPTLPTPNWSLSK